MILLLLALLTFQAEAKEPLKGCLGEYEKNVVNASLKIRVGQDWDLCNPQNRYYQLVEALTLMQNLSWQGDTAPAPYNQEILGYDWYGLFTSRVRNIAWGEAEDPRTCRGALAYAHPGTKNIFTCMQLYSTEENANYAGYSNVVSMIGVLIHEARHLMNGRNGFPHTSCNGQAQGCDKSAPYKGAMAAEMEAYAKMGLTASNLHPVQAGFARRMAYVTAVDRFVKRPIDQLPDGERLPVFRTKDNRFMSIADGTIYSFFTGIKNGRMIEWMGGMFETYLLFPEDGSPAQTLNSWDWYPREDYRRFNEEENASSPIDGYLSSPTIKRLATDRSFSVKGSLLIRGSLSGSQLAWIIGDKVVIEHGDMPYESRTFQFSSQHEYSLPNGEIPIAIRSGLVTGKTDSGYIYVVSDKDRLYKFATDFDYDSRPIKLRGFKMTEEPNPYPGFTHVYGLDNFNYLLDKEGRAYRLREGGRPSLVPGLEGYRFSSIEFHYYHDIDVPAELRKR